MIDHLYKQWNIKNEHIVSDVFTGYESVYDKLDSYNKEQYDKDPDAVIDAVFNIYRSIGLVPIIYYTEQGLIQTVKEFSNLSYNGVNDNVIGLGNNRGQTINRFLFPNMMTAEPKGRGSNSLRDRFWNDAKLKRAIRICFEFRTGDRLLRPTQS